MNKFKVGDRVRIRNKNFRNYGKIGEIIRLKYFINEDYPNNNLMAVKIDNDILCINSNNLKLVKEKENDKEFTLKDLTDDMIVEIRNGRKYLIISNTKIMMGLNNWNEIKSYDNDLTNRSYCDLNIDKVWKIKSINGYSKLSYLLTDKGIDYQIKMGYMELVYDRNKPQPKKMTVQQICDELGYEVEIIKE